MLLSKNEEEHPPEWFSRSKWAVGRRIPPHPDLLPGSNEGHVEG